MDLSNQSTVSAFKQKFFALEDILTNNHMSIISSFRKDGMITSKNFHFITYANFNDKQNCSIDYEEFRKSEVEATMAKNNLNIVKAFLSDNVKHDIHLNYIMRKCNECIIYDTDKYNSIIIQEKFYDFFGK